MTLYGWIEVASSNNCGFCNTSEQDIIIRTITPTNQIVIGNSTSNITTNMTLSAALYINGNNVGIAKQPSEGVQLDVNGMTILQSCQIGNQTQPTTKLDIYGSIDIKNAYSISNIINISNSNGEVQFKFDDGCMPLKITNRNGIIVDDILFVSKDVIAQGFNMMSDEKLKTNINTSHPENDIDIINNLNVVDFKWRDNSSDVSNKGFIAQEVQEAFPNAVKDGNVKTIDLSQIVALNTSVIKSLLNRINRLEKYMAGY